MGRHTPTGMRQVTRSGGLRHSRVAARASTFIEFAMVLPMFLFLMLFTFDMGQIILMNGAMQDATFSAARTGAQAGGAGIQATSGVVGCTNGSNCGSGGSTAARTFYAATDQIPFAKLNTVTKFVVKNGAVCTNATSHVNVESQFKVELITPGLNAMLTMMDGQSRGPDGDWNMKAVGVARCEVIRTA